MKKRCNILFAFYDLSVAPPTFDFIQFLLLSEGHRILWGCSNIHVIVVPGYHQGFRKKIPEREIGESRLRVYNIIQGSCQLLESISGFTYCSSREESYLYFNQKNIKVYPKEYSPEKPIARYLWNPIRELLNEGVKWPSLKAPKFAIESAKKICENFASGKKIVTVNLRNSSIQTSRNSNHSEWLKVCRFLNSKDYKIILIDDTDSFNHKPFASPDYAYIGSEFTWNVPLRTALYENCLLNLFVNNGPAALSMHNSNTKCLVFKIIDEQASSTKSEFFQRHNLEIGQPAFFAGPFNRWIWKNDDASIIIQEFENMVKEISE